MLSSVGRPLGRWTDDLKRVAGSGWMTKTGDPGEADVQQWTAIGL